MKPIRTLFTALFASLAMMTAAYADETTQSDAPIEVIEMTQGSADAKVTFVEYASFTCPHCANFHMNVYPQLKADYIDTGKINFVYREVYFDRFGLWAGMIARCGGEDRYFGIADMLYARQPDWSRNADPMDNIANMKKIGKLAGMTDEQMDTCLNDQAHAEALVAAFQTNASADEITATPSFIINGKKYSNMNYPEIKDVIDGLLE